MPSPPRASRLVVGLLWLVVLGTVFALSFTVLMDPDLGFHIATGREVLARHGIPATNVLSFTQPTYPWILHEWLPAVIFEVAWSRVGPGGVLAIKIAVLLATWSTVMLTARRLGASWLAAAAATVLGAVAASPRFVERPHIFSNLSLAIVALLLATAARSEPGRRRLRIVLAAGGVAALTAHVHAGAITSMLLIGTVAVGAALEPARARALRIEASGPAGLDVAARLVAVVVGSIVVAVATLSLYHPHALRVLWVPFQLGGDEFLHQHVIEYRSPLRFEAGMLAGYWFLFTLIAILVGMRVRHTPATRFIPVLVFAILSLRYVRTVDAFAVISTPVLAASLEDLLASRPFLRAATLVVSLVGFAIAGTFLRWSKALPGLGLHPAVWPADMLDFIEREKMEGPAFVSDGWAGPYLARFYPREHAFFDARFEAYSPDFVRNVYQRVRYGEPGWEQLLDQYGVEYLLLKYTSPGEQAFQRGRANVRQHLARSPHWSLVAFTDNGELFVRRGGRNAELAERLAIRGLDPDSGAFLTTTSDTLPTLLAAIARGFQDNRVLALTAILIAKTGDSDSAQKLLDQADRQHPDDPQVADVRDFLEKVGPVKPTVKRERAADENKEP